MKQGHWLMLGALALGGVLLYKYRGALANIFTPDPTVSAALRAHYGRAQDVPATIGRVTGVSNSGADAAAAASLFGIVGDVLSGAGSSGTASYGGTDTTGMADNAGYSSGSGSAGLSSSDAFGTMDV